LAVKPERRITQVKACNLPGTIPTKNFDDSC
jgi:hypothetical protein